MSNSLPALKLWVWSLFAFSAIAGGVLPWVKSSQDAGLVVGTAAIAMVFAMVVKRKEDFTTFMAPSLAGLMLGGAVSALAKDFQKPIIWLVFVTLLIFAAMITRTIVFDLEQRSPSTPKV